MKVLGIYGSPRKGGNSDLLLNKALEGARSAGADVSSVYVRDLKISGCLECDGCIKTGECIVNDEMEAVYPLLKGSDVIFLSTPIFFYGVTSQVKALIDRCQAMWSKRMVEKKGEERKIYESGTGYLLAVGATKGKNLFDGAKLTARYFFDALNMDYQGGLFFTLVEGKGAIVKHPEALHQAFELGRKAVKKIINNPLPLDY